MMHKRRTEQGMSIITVVFMLVIMSSAAAFMLEIIQLQQASTQLRFLEGRAMQLAQAGIEEGKYRVFTQMNPAVCHLGSRQDELVNLTIEDDPSIGPFSVETHIGCTQVADRIVSWKLGSEVEYQSPGNPLYVSRGLIVEYVHKG